MASAPEQLQEAKKLKRAVTADELKREDTSDAVDELKRCRGSDEALKRNQAEQRNVQTTPYPAVNVDLKAEAGANAFLPVIIGNTVHGSMTFNPAIGQHNPAEGQTSEKQVQRSEPEDRRNASISVEDQPIQSDWKRPHSITHSSQEFKNRILEDKNNVYIPMDKSQRERLALLITNIQFKHLKYRTGAARDEENMEWLLTALGYRVEKYRDQTGKQISARVRNFAARLEHEDSDSTFVVLMSHGGIIQNNKDKGVKYEDRIKDLNKDAILGVNYDEEENPDDFFIVDDIFSSLSLEKCPALRDKPKVILIQACRGGHTGGVDIQSDSIEHIEKDFVCFKSCLPGIQAYRNPVEGSFFIMYIVDVFSKQARNNDIMELFRKVTLRMENDPRFTGLKKLMPCIDRTSLPKKLYLFPGL